MEKSLRLLFITLLFSLPLPGLSQVESSLTCRRFTVQDGLPQMQTERLWQDTRGYIYIGTLSGFARYDGRSFTPFLKGRRFNIVGFAEVDGAVRAFDFRRAWVTSSDKVVPQPIDPQGGRLLNNFNSPMLPDGFILLEDEQETHRRLCRVTNRRLEVIEKSPLLDQMTPDRKVLLDTARCEVFIPLQSGVWQISTHKRAVCKLTDKGDFYSLILHNKSLLAFAADGIYSFRGGRFRRIAAADWSAASYGLIVRTLANGHLVIADEHSVYEYDGKTVRLTATGFNLVKDLMVDRWDRLWVATYQGLYCYFNREFTNHRLSDPDDIVRAIGASDDGHIVMGSLNGKLLVDNNIVKDNPDNFFAPCAATINNKVYMAANGDIMRMNGTGECDYLGLPLDHYLFVAKAGERLIVGSRKSICAYSPQTQKLDTLYTDISHPWCAAQDGQGHLWVGSTFGLFEDGKKVDYTQQLIVSSMERDSNGNIVFASKDSLFLIRDGQVQLMYVDGLADHEVRSLHVSPKGFIVIAVIDGLFVGRLNPDYTVSDVRFFNHLNGFTALEPLMATMAETSDGTVWMAGIEEVTSFRPAELLTYNEEDCYIRPPMQWWQHWWIWALGLLLLAVAVWSATRSYEKRRNRRRMIRLQKEKQQREQQIETIRQKAIKDATNQLAKDILKMTEKDINERITLRTTSGTVVTEIKDIAFFKADGNYSQMVTFHSSTTVLMSLGTLEKQLSPAIFTRADRSTLVNIHLIAQLLPKQRRCLFRATNGDEVETTLLSPAFKRLQDLL